MQNKRYISAAVIMAILIAIIASVNSANKNKETKEQQEIVKEVEAENENVHTVSLPALMKKEFNGSDFKLGEVLDNNSVYTRYYISYKSGDLTISGIMNIPKGDGPFPVLILNHGYIDPAIYTNGRGLRREQDYLARQGYAVIHPDYRNHAQSSKDPDADVNLRLGYVEDVINAVYAIKKANIPSLDTENVGMLGHSMGGGVTLNTLVVKPGLVKAAVLFAPVSSDQRDNFERWVKTRKETADRIVELFGSPDQSPEFWDNISAKTFFDRITSSVMLHHGTADADVPIKWSDRLNELLNAANVEIKYHVYLNQPHEFTSAWPDVMQKTTEFFNARLK